ncbi:flagellar biosynthesis protein FlhB [Fodinibius halophilus]|uniref:Flagellar biosynthetic protein FlhB n=1 Tax=Fodinibius halophilus TaxID=1736908 RepID=A0A6M1STW2_9BACT|nr:flagellar biosynthesis protein FlhB [Fodinibius halophilus]NGP87378.1 flagellar biosynthesis protein FlhB [Fodinibius halophilus]
MSDQNSAQEKTEDPTQQRLEKAREEGNVSVSKEVSSVVIMVVSLFTIMSSGEFIYGKFVRLFETFFLNSGAPIENQDQALAYLKEALFYGLEAMTPLIIVLLVTALLVNAIQTKMAFSIKALEPKFSNLNPIEGIKNIFSKKGLMELAKGVVKLTAVVTIARSTVTNNINTFLSFSVMPLEHDLQEAASYILIFLGKVFVALFVLSVVDALYQQYQHKEDLKMSKKEVKDERKESEGDPQMKGKRKQMGQALRSKRMDHAVLESDVVVTNPTHYAVALQYDPEENSAPLVMAKGQRYKAQKIKKLARELDVPIVENKPVAQALFASAEVDQHIPEDMYRAVAEILAYVYKLKNKHNI